MLSAQVRTMLKGYAYVAYMATKPPSWATKRKEQCH